MIKKRTGPTDEEKKTHIQQLKEKANDLAGGTLMEGGFGDSSLEIQEPFWEQVVAFENAETGTLFDALVATGLSLPHPKELSDSEIAQKLSEMFQTLALLRVFLEATDHLSDRQLYDHLWNISLREEIAIVLDLDYACHLDLVGSGSEEDNHLYMKYYADEEYRQQWAREWPDDPVPEKEALPFDRDRFLPKPWNDVGNA